MHARLEINGAAGQSAEEYLQNFKQLVENPGR